MAILHGEKFVTVGKLKELLEQLGDDGLWITARTLGDTGNLGVFENNGDEFVGYIDLKYELFESSKDLYAKEEHLDKE